MNKLLLLIAFLVITLSSCKKYYNCTCVRVVQTLSPASTIANPIYTTSTTTYTTPVLTTKTSSASKCSGLSGSSGLTTITCGIEY